MHKVISMVEQPLETLLPKEARIGHILELIKTHPQAVVAEADRLLTAYQNETDQQRKIALLALIIFISIIHEEDCNPAFHDKLETEFTRLVDKNETTSNVGYVDLLRFIQSTDQYDNDFNEILVQGIINLIKKVRIKHEASRFDLPFKPNMSEPPRLGDILHHISDNQKTYVAQAEQLFTDYTTEQDAKLKTYRLVLVTFTAIIHKEICSRTFLDNVQKEFIWLFETRDDPAINDLLKRFFIFINSRDQHYHRYGLTLDLGLSEILKHVKKIHP